MDGIQNRLHFSGNDVPEKGRDRISDGFICFARGLLRIGEETRRWKGLNQGRLTNGESSFDAVGFLIFSVGDAAEFDVSVVFRTHGGGEFVQADLFLPLAFFQSGGLGIDLLCGIVRCIGFLQVFEIVADRALDLVFVDDVPVLTQSPPFVQANAHDDHTPASLGDAVLFTLDELIRYVISDLGEICDDLFNGFSRHRQQSIHVFCYKDDGFYSFYEFDVGLIERSTGGVEALSFARMAEILTGKSACDDVGVGEVE